MKDYFGSKITSGSDIFFIFAGGWHRDTVARIKGSVARIIHRAHNNKQVSVCLYLGSSRIVSSRHVAVDSLIHIGDIVAYR